MGGRQGRLWGAPRLSARRREPEEGDVETGRGKKARKAWQLNLKLMDVICAGIGIVGLMCMSFLLGALAGRGDIYRVASSLGLMKSEAKPAAPLLPQIAQVPPAGEAPAAAEAPAAPAVAAAPAPAASAKAPHTAPVTGSMAPLPPPAAAASSRKKAKSAQAQHEQKAREEQLRQHQDVAKKLTFLNSFDSTPKPGLKKDKDKGKAAAAKPPAQVKVAVYRNSKSAQAKVAELQKKGIKASVKQGKDAKGACYTVYRQAPAAAPKEPEKVAQNGHTGH